MIDPTDPLQAAIVAAVRAMSPKVTVYDEPPASATYPYVSLSGIAIEPDGDGECYDGSIATATLHICDNDPGTKTARAIGKRLLAALDAPLTIAGFRVVLQYALPALYTPDPDGPVRGSLRFVYDLAPAGA